ncbi:MAG TPA: hypothetical protein VMW08_11250 [Acidimicrobiales bacterium]|nr:hypothetical protein [Acidimicrobiales bacterium]
MPECLAVDPADLEARAQRFHSLGRDLEPRRSDAEHLADELGAIGSPSYAEVGRQFSASWALALAFLVDGLDEIGARLDEASQVYRMFEGLLAEALDW